MDVTYLIDYPPLIFHPAMAKPYHVEDIMRTLLNLAFDVTMNTEDPDKSAVLEGYQNMAEANGLEEEMAHIVGHLTIADIPWLPDEVIHAMILEGEERAWLELDFVPPSRIIVMIDYFEDEDQYIEKMSDRNCEETVNHSQYYNKPLMGLQAQSPLCKVRTT